MPTISRSKIKSELLEELSKIRKTSLNMIQQSSTLMFVKKTPNSNVKLITDVKIEVYIMPSDTESNAYDEINLLTNNGFLEVENRTSDTGTVKTFEYALGANQSEVVDKHISFLESVVSRFMARTDSEYTVKP